MLFHGEGFLLDECRYWLRPATIFFSIWGKKTSDRMYKFDRRLHFNSTALTSLGNPV